MNHIKTEQIGGDADWWAYGGIFYRTFEQGGVSHREVWKVYGLEDEYPETEVDEDDPSLVATCFRGSLPLNPEDIIPTLSWMSRSDLDLALLAEGSKPYLSIAERVLAEMMYVMGSRRTWVDFGAIASQYDWGMAELAMLPDYCLLAEVGDHSGWANLDSYPIKLSRAEIQEILLIE